MGLLLLWWWLWLWLWLWCLIGSSIPDSRECIIQAFSCRWTLWSAFFSTDCIKRQQDGIHHHTRDSMKFNNFESFERRQIQPAQVFDHRFPFAKYFDDFTKFYFMTYTTNNSRRVCTCFDEFPPVIPSSNTILLIHWSFYKKLD